MPGGGWAYVWIHVVIDMCTLLTCVRTNERTNERTCEVRFGLVWGVGRMDTDYVHAYMPTTDTRPDQDSQRPLATTSKGQPPRGHACR